MYGISIIIPIFNEAPNLPGLLDAVMTQTLKPDEVIFVDSGSTDKTDQIITEYSNDSIQIRHIKNIGGMPGGNRNKGVLESKHDWLAFIDAGIIPSSDWLEELMRCAKQNNTKAIFGKCKFTGTTSFSHAVCAVSYGCTSHPVIPASIFHKDIFKEVGLFPENLRAGEDTIWLRRYDNVINSRIATNSSVATYKVFPESLSSLAQKYWNYDKSLKIAGLGGMKAVLLICFFSTTVFSLIINLKATLFLLATYFIARGLLDPARRSQSLIWWKGNSISILIAPLCALTIDITIAVSRMTSKW